MSPIVSSWVAFPEIAEVPPDAVGELFSDGDAVFIRPAVLARIERAALDLARVDSDAVELAEDAIDRILPDETWPERGGHELLVHVSRIVERARAQHGLPPSSRVSTPRGLRFSTHRCGGGVR